MNKNRYKAKKGRSEELNGSVYYARPKLGRSTEVRMRHIVGNEYGKKATPERPTPTGMPGFPHRTMIRE